MSEAIGICVGIGENTSGQDVVVVSIPDATTFSMNERTARFFSEQLNNARNELWPLRGAQGGGPK